MPTDAGYFGQYTVDQTAYVDTDILYALVLLEPCKMDDTIISHSFIIFGFNCIE